MNADALDGRDITHCVNQYLFIIPIIIAALELWKILLWLKNDLLVDEKEVQTFNKTALSYYVRNSDNAKQYEYGKFFDEHYFLSRITPYTEVKAIF